MSNCCRNGSLKIQCEHLFWWKFGAILLGFLGASMASMADGGTPDPNYLLRLVSTNTPVENQAVTVTCVLDMPNAPGPISGWSMGVCHDSKHLNPVAATLGSTALIVNGGQPPDFFILNVIPEGSKFIVAPGATAGVNLAVVISLMSINSLPVGENYEILDIVYDGLLSGNSQIHFCETTPAGAASFVAENVIVTEMAASAIPEVQHLFIEILPPPYVLGFADGAAGFGQTAPAGSDGELTTTVLLNISSIAESVAAWSFGVCHDPSYLNAVAASSGSTTQTVFSGAPPEFEQINIIDNDSPLAVSPFAPGVNQSVVISSGGGSYLAQGVGYELLEISYERLAIGSSDLVFCGNTYAGTTGVSVSVTTETGESEVPLLEPSMIELGSFSGFIRGDVDGDGAIELFDAVVLLNYLYRSGPQILCRDASDSNDDGQLNAADPVHSLNYLFLGGLAPTAPQSTCGADPTPDVLDCESSLACP